MDDFVLFGDLRGQLVGWRERVGEFLERECALQLKHAGPLDRTAAGIGCLGMLVLPGHVRLMAKTKRRVRVKGKGLVSGQREGRVTPCRVVRAWRAPDR